MLKSDKFMVAMLVLFPLLGFVLPPFVGNPGEVWGWILVCEGFLAFWTYLLWGIEYDVQTSSEGETE